ncbi:hypothetical protein JCM9279_000902 [Rhodotorula babjevae]
MAPPADSRTLVSALSSLVLVTAALALVYHARSAAEPAQVHQQHEPDEPPQPRYKTKRERFSLASHRWELDVDSDDDCGDPDDDEAGEGTGETVGDDSKVRKKKKKERSLFTVSHRSYPKMPEWASFEDYVAVALESKLLVDSLRDVHALQGCEEVFEDKPSIDARDLYLARDEIRKHQSTVRDEATRLAAAEAADDKPLSSVDGAVEPSAVPTRTSTPDDQKDQAQPLIEPKIKTASALENEAHQLEVLLTFIDELFASTSAKLRRLLEPPSTSTTLSSQTTSPSDWHPQISYALLWALFKPGSIAVGDHEESGEKVAFRVLSCEYSVDRKESLFNVRGQAVVWNGDAFVRHWVQESIGKFKGLRRLSSLSVAPLDTSSALYAHLVSRGKQYVALTGAAHPAEGGSGVRFLDYNDILIQVVGRGPLREIFKSRAEGRDVVDVKGYRKMMPGQASMEFFDPDDWDPVAGPPPVRPPVLDELADPTSSTSSTPLRPTQVAPSDLALLPPTVHGFSLVVREWGELLVEHFSEIQFREDAFERLVLDAETKRLVKGLVEYSNTASKRRVQGRAAAAAARSGAAAGEVEREPEKDEARPAQRTDIIDGKGGGLVIALHGPPGTGKTLTAQAVAETLRVPLYTVGAGSLGVQADVLEKRLRDVLDVAEQWGATLLIDEADVFLAKRTIGDLQRNAMVSVFLRLLEHHSGTLILTTNSIRSIDEAFLSRFSIAITYPNLDRDKRRTIWRSFLELAGVGISTRSSSTSASSTATPNGLASTISPTYLDSLAAHSSLNGRQIKNAVRTAQAHARSQGLAAPGEEHLDVVIKAVEAFKRDLEEADEQGVYEVAGEGWKDSTSIFN